MSVAEPSDTFSELILPVATIDPMELVRLSRFNTGEPYFGRSKANRFDDPRFDTASQRFGTCYFGLSLAGAFAETVLRNRTAAGGGFSLTASELERYVIGFEGDSLQVAALFGKSLLTLGGNGALSTITPYDIPQQWSLAIHRHPASVDGFAYVSRHLNTEMAIVLFDRAQPKLRVRSVTRFADTAGALRVTRDFHIRVV